MIDTLIFRGSRSRTPLPPAGMAPWGKKSGTTGRKSKEVGAKCRRRRNAQEEDRFRCPHQPSTLDPQPSTLNPQPSTLNPQPSTLNPRP
ncbi:hypothetical protein T484DRAFT_2784557 [Baffinella frigidus]|nr:hypothetical protein T484DRAFT_2784557 [Cryptophyta sp. CCMP2293]